MVTTNPFLKFILGAILLVPCIAWAGKADVLEVQIIETGTDTYRVTATVRHADTGWDHYADKWDVIGPDGQVFGTRELLHPHVDEQPFTRSLNDVKISPEVQSVTVQAHDSVHGYGGSKVSVDVP
jgi:hypothetical protein